MISSSEGSQLNDVINLRHDLVFDDVQETAVIRIHHVLAVLSFDKHAHPLLERIEETIDVHLVDVVGGVGRSHG